MIRIFSVLRLMVLGCLLPLAAMHAGCTTLRITDPDHTADELFLENYASKLAVDQLSATVLRDRRVYLDCRYLTAATQPSDQHQFMIGELRAKLLLGGVRLTEQRSNAEIIMELRSQGISVNRYEFLLGIPASSVGGIFTGGLAAQTPELSIVKTVKQHGFANVAFVAYWADTGEVVAASGPFTGRTTRDDYWVFGAGPRTIGNIAPALPAPVEAADAAATTGGKNAASSPAPAEGRPVRTTGKP